jgi:iron complex transport system ATP-binding protein
VEHSARIDVAGLSCDLNGVAALLDLSLVIPPATLFGLVGPNGAGKTTLLRAMSGVLQPHGGVVLVEGRDPHATPAAALARMMAVLPQHPTAPPGITVREAVAWGRGPHIGRLSHAGAADLRAIHEAMAQTGTLALAERSVDALSGGERHRVLIARALAQSPRILLLDEPTVHLDIGHQIEIMEVLRAQAGRGLTVVAALHDLNLAAAYCDRLALLAAGRILACGEPADALRPNLIRDAYGAAVEMRVNSITGRPYLTVSGTSVGAAVASTGRAAGRPLGPRVHVICGGGTGSPLLTRCAQAGYQVSVGVLHVMDTDHETARTLGCDVIEEAPFSPVGARAAAAAAAAARSAAAVIVAPMPVGPGNLRNLEVAEVALASGVPVVIVDGVAERDFTGGTGSEAAARLAAGGARVVPDLVAAFDVLLNLAPVAVG